MAGSAVVPALPEFARPICAALLAAFATASYQNVRWGVKGLMEMRAIDVFIGPPGEQIAAANRVGSIGQIIETWALLLLEFQMRWFGSFRAGAAWTCRALSIIFLCRR
jgi:hypothetical protein